MTWIETALGGREAGPLFVNRAGNRMTRANSGRAVSKIAGKAGFGARDITPHALRRSATEIALSSGVPLRDVQDWLGHASSTTTEWYDRRPMTPDRSPGMHVQAAVA